MQFLGIFIGLLFAWICIGFVWPSLMAVIALSLTGLDSMNCIIAHGFGNNVTVFVLLMLILVLYFERAGIYYAAINIPITLFLLLLFVFMMRYVFKVNVDRLYSITEDKFAEHRARKLSMEEKIAFSSVAFFIAIMAMPTILPQDWAITAITKKFGMTGSIVLVFALLTMFRLNKKPVLDFSKTANGGKIGWEVIIMYAACMPVSDAMSRPEVGITNIVMDYCMPILGHLSTFQFLIITVVVITLLTQFLHNLVLAAIATPLLVQFSIAANCDPSLLIIVLCFAYGFSTTTPAASAASSLVFLNDWSPTKTTYKVLIAHFIIGLAIVAAFFVPVVYMLY